MGMKWRNIKQIILLMGLGFALVGSGWLACSVSNPEDEEEGGGDADSDADSDSDADADPPCIASIVGTAVYGNGDPLDVPFQLCAPNCTEVMPDDNGDFEVQIVGEGDDDDDDDNDDDSDSSGYYADGCRYYDFDDPNDYIRVILGQPDPNPDKADTHAEYAVHFEPTDNDVSGDDVYDLGKLKLYKLNGDAVEYTAEAGATVDFKGALFTLGPGTLEEWVLDGDSGQMVMQPVDKANLKVFKANLDDWNPPFNYFGLDALYYFGPYWTKVKNYGVVISFEAPAGASDGDTGTLYMLSHASGQGRLAYSEDLRYCTWTDGGAGYIEESALASCGQVIVKDGKVVTPPVPMLGWVGFIMDEPDTSGE